MSIPDRVYKTNLEVALGVAADRAKRTGTLACVYFNSVAWFVSGLMETPPRDPCDLVCDVEPDGSVTWHKPESKPVEAV